MKEPQALHCSDNTSSSDFGCDRRLVTLGVPPDQELAGRYKVHAMFFVV
jgi:NADPH:quinone reductase-like Zn-dependent oxidoreductase